MFTTSIFFISSSSYNPEAPSITLSARRAGRRARHWLRLSLSHIIASPTYTDDVIKPLKNVTFHFGCYFNCTTTTGVIAQSLLLIQ